MTRTDSKPILHRCLRAVHPLKNAEGHKKCAGQIAIICNTQDDPSAQSSDDLNAQVYEGIWENDSWTFYRDRIGTADQMWLLRVRYVQRPNCFTQTAELTKNRGKTWVKASSTDYVRKPSMNR